MNRGLKTSELMQELKKCIDNFGDLYVYKEKNGDAKANLLYKSLSKY